MPGGDPRNYPSCGSSVLLPLKASGSEAEVLVCGGAPKGSYIAVSTNNTFVGALATCGRIKITDKSPTWSVETMPTRRVMGDMVMLPTGRVLIINGAASGTAGWEFGKDPVLTPVIYSPDSAAGARFEVQNPATTPRIYHSTAILLRDGRVLVGGSNPHVSYVFSGVQYPTDLSLEAYSPEYLSSSYSNFRPKIIAPASSSSVGYGKQFTLQFTVRSLVGRTVSVTMVAPSFTTHSVSMNQRLLVLDSSLINDPKNSSTYSVVATAPASGNYAPSGYYMVFVVNAGIPSVGVWVHVQ
ncbi:aldehyde oxidase GLOX-like [Iris pallida]|uniref:Aldehyde oxidase GLOX-like n=1 Tax=Iris pallida TaxID=29817 RepID=A0AAX6H8H2_IRIPA|nr:aldehyde oxidase GLOX-like [Iris pallida]